MKFDTHTYNQIENFLLGKLNEEESRVVKDRMQADTYFREEVELYQTMLNTALGYDMMALKQKMKNDFARADRNKNSWYTGLAILFIACLSVGAWFFTWKDSRNNQAKQPDKAVIEKQKFINEANTFSYSNKKSVAQAQLNNASINAPANIVSISRDTNHLQLEDMQKEIPVTAIVANKDTHTEVKEKTVDPVIHKVEACPQMNPKAVLLPSAPDRNTGSIQIKTESLDDSKAPYQFALYELDSEFSSSTRFYNLAPGSYTLGVRDSKGCVSKITTKYEIRTGMCMENYEKVFSPEYDHTWTIPVLESKVAKVEIFNTGGRIVYQVNTIEGNKVYWDGNSYEGGLALPGVYKVVIRYEEGESCLAEVTIAR